MIKYFIPYAFIVSLLFSCKSQQEKVKPSEEKITESVYASGVVKSDHQYQVFGAVNGLVDQIMVTEGDLVKKGDPIMRLSHTAAKLSAENAGIAAQYSSTASNAEKLSELRINIGLSKTKLANDSALVARQRNLWAQQIGTKNELEQRELAYQTSLNTFQGNKLRYTELQKQISFAEKQSIKNLEISKTASSDYTIVSNADGKIYNVLKKVGEMVNTQSPVALMGDASIFILELQVDEYDIASIRLGQKIILSMDSYKGKVFEAAVSKIYPLMNDRSKSFTVEALFKQQPAHLYPALTCEANIIITTKDKALTIPRNYLLADDYVMLADKTKRKVTTGLKDYQKVEILGGITIKDVILKPGE